MTSARWVNRPEHPCRLSVFCAGDAPAAVVLRRGPSDWVQLNGWDRRDDSVTPGQWFRGRVYERRCDLSPDGRLFVYFAAKHGRPASDVGEAWTAVSRPPYFTALTLWPNLGSWYGGGYFEENQLLLLDATCGRDHHPSSSAPKLRVGQVAVESAPWEQRLLRAGWRLIERGFDPRTHRRVGDREIWAKRLSQQPATLFRQVEDYDPKRYGSPEWDTYWIESDDDLTPLPEVSWAEVDGDRLILTRASRLMAGDWRDGALRVTTLHDFNHAKPEEVATPDWARQW